MTKRYKPQRSCSERDREVARWYEREDNPENLDFLVSNGGEALRHIEQYKYWRDRIVQLKDAFDESRPRTFRKW